MVLSLIAGLAAVGFLIAGTIKFMDAPHGEPGAAAVTDSRPWFRRRRYLLGASAGLAAVFLIASVATTSGPTADDRAEAQQETVDAQAQMWEAMGYDGSVPSLDAATVGSEVDGVVALADRILMDGSSSTDCVALSDSYQALFMAEFDDEERQSYLDALTDSLSQAISGCEDGRWQNAMVDVVEAGVIAGAYGTKY